MQFETKLPDVGTTIFTVMSKLAADSGAINLGQGFPDENPPREVVEALGRFALEGHNQYPPMPGVPTLRQCISDRVASDYGRRVNPDTEVTITTGATEALFAVMGATLRSGDEVILMDPAYDAYRPGAQLQGAKPVHVPMTLPDFRIDWNRVSDATSSRTRLIVVNSPHNPTGRTLKREDLDALADIAERCDALVLADDAYEHIVFDGKKHESTVSCDRLWPRLFAVSSFGKTFHATGWKVGYCVAPEPLTVELRKIHQYLTFTTMGPAQLALAEYMSGAGTHIDELSSFYQSKRDLFVSALEGSRFKLPVCEGTYFQLADYSSISDQDDNEFARWLTTEVGVAAIPLSPFCVEGTEEPLRLVRFCFAKDDSVLLEAADKLCQI